MNDFLELGSGVRLRLDEHGHLADRAQWSDSVAEVMSQLDGIDLLPGHWAVIFLVQDYFDEYGIEIPMRALVLRLRDSGWESIATSLQLYKLFPEGPVRQAHRYAGLPIPVSCI